MIAYETPVCANGVRAYAEKLATYLNDAQSIHLACRRNYGPDNIPSRKAIQGMIDARKARVARQVGRAA